MKTKFFYLNDRKIPVTVFRHTLNASDKLATLQPAESRLFDIDVPEGSVLWIKTWEYGAVLISHVLSELAEHLDQEMKGKQ
jgi:hypothetical protein